MNNDFINGMIYALRIVEERAKHPPHQIYKKLYCAVDGNLKTDWKDLVSQIEQALFESVSHFS